MLSSRHNKSAGFSIVELMIVLAIAGVIAMVIFQAIPSLQRSSRNNQRKQDVSTVLAAVSRYELTHSGDVPSCISDCGLAPNFLQHTCDKLAYYQCNLIDFRPLLPGDTSNALNVNDIDDHPEWLLLYNYSRCPSDETARIIHNAAGYFDVVAIYVLEGANDTFHVHCQEL